MFLRSIWLILYWYMRPVLKWFLRKTTKLCELQRICYGERPGAPRILGVEKSLQLSRNKSIKDLIENLDMVASNCLINEHNRKDMVAGAACVILRAKRINHHVHSHFGPAFEKCVEQIWGYRQLFHEVESKRITQYDSNSLDHEVKLIELWNLLMPHEPLEGRVTKQWQDIGFQVGQIK